MLINLSLNNAPLTISSGLWSNNSHLEACCNGYAFCIFPRSDGGIYSLSVQKSEDNNDLMRLSVHGLTNATLDRGQKTEEFGIVSRSGKCWQYLPVYSQPSVASWLEFDALGPATTEADAIWEDAKVSRPTAVPNINSIFHDWRLTKLSFFIVDQSRFAICEVPI